MNPQALDAAISAIAAAITGLPDAIAYANLRAGMHDADQGRVSAFDRPQSVIILGPSPLPVSGMGGGPPAPKKEEKEKPGALAQILDVFSGKFLAILGPLAILATVVGNAASGFQVLSKSVQLFAATLAPLILPATVLLAAAFTALSDVVMAALGPGLESFFSIVLALGIPAMVVLIDASLKLAKVFGDIARSKGAKAAETAADVGSNSYFQGAVLPLLKIAESDAGLASIFPAFGIGKALGFGGGGSTPATPGATPATPGAGTVVGGERTDGSTILMGALSDVMQSLRNSIGAKPQISGLESVGKGVQMAAFGDPIEARMLRTQEQILRALETAVAGMGGMPGRVYDPTPPATPRPGGG